jgi:hypothetical protein
MFSAAHTSFTEIRRIVRPTPLKYFAPPSVNNYQEIYFYYMLYRHRFSTLL